MKRRDPMRKVLIFLRHLESNFNNPKKRLFSTLEKTFPPKKEFSDIKDFCLHRNIIKLFPVGKGESRDYDITLTLEGYEYLEKLRRNERDKQTHKFQRQLVITSLILAMGVSLNAVVLIDSTNSAFKGLFLTILLGGILGLTLYVIVNFFTRE